MTWVVAEISHKDWRQIFYVTLDHWWRTDGLSSGLARKRYRDSVIVDALTLGPLPRTHRRPALTYEQRMFVQHWTSHYRKCWQEKLVAKEPCKLLQRTLWERVFHRPIFARHVMLRSETGIKWFMRDPTLWDYVVEGAIMPTIPNQVTAHSLGDGKREVVAFAEIAPVVQADAGLSAWCQRCWWIDHSRAPVFGLDAIGDGNYARCVVPRSIHPGVDSEPFDPRNVRKYPVQDYIVLGDRDHFRDCFLKHYKEKQ